jgi:hypothetical protein
VKFDVRAGDGAVLRVVHDAVDLAEDGSVDRWSGKQQETKQSKLAHGTPIELTILDFRGEMRLLT